MGKGSRSERELFTILWSKGYGVMRSPASGGGRKHAQPDLLCSNGKDILALELKSTEEGPVYVGKDEIKDLRSFCTRFRSIPIIGIRRNRKGWVFHHPNQAIETKKSYKFEEGMDNINLINE